jgi:mannan endo-1,4-beta-mannosidase
MTINWSHVSTSGANQDLSVTYAFNAVSPAAPTADVYVAFDLSSSHSTLAPGESAVFAWQLQGPNPATDVYDQTKDYSFSASTTTLTHWDHVTLYQGGTLVWGTPP